jgi:thiamine transporter ThiT
MNKKAKDTLEWIIVIIIIFPLFILSSLVGVTLGILTGLKKYIEKKEKINE